MIVKAVKIALIGIVGLLLLLVAAVAILSLPGIQRALVTHFVATEVGESLEMDHFRVGLTRTEARQVDFRQPDTSYQVAEFSADFSLFDLIFKRELRMGNVVARGVVIDLSKLEPTKDPEPFEGILRQMDLPMPLYLASLNVEGEVLLPGDGEESARSHFVVTSGRFAPGEEGDLRLVGRLQAPGSLEMLASLGIEGNLTVQQGNQGRIEQARLVAQLSEGHHDHERPERIRADVLLLATDDGEAYQARLGRVLINQESEAEESGELDLATLVSLDATFLYGEGLIEGRWEMDIDRERLAAFVGEIELPAFAATGGGEFSYGIAGEILDLNGQLDVRVDDLGMLSEELRELGGFGLNSRFNMRIDEGFFRLDELVLALQDQEETNLLEARNFQTIRYNRQTERIEGIEGRLDLAELSIQAFPIEWINLFLQPEEGEAKTMLRGGNLTGQLQVSTDDGGVFFHLTEPLRANGVSVFSDGDPLLEDLSFAVQGEGSFVNGEIRSAIEQVRIYHQRELVAAGRGEYLPGDGRLRAELKADLSRLMTQPILTAANNLQAGTVDLEVTLDFGGPMTIRANGTLSDLVSREERERLPRAVFQIDLQEFEQNGNLWEIDAPIRIEGGGSSTDLRLAGRLEIRETINRVALTLSGDRLVVDQVLALATGFTPANNDQERSSERDEEPLWDGFEGVVSVNIATLQLRPEYGMKEVGGDLALEGGEVISALRGTFLDSPVALDARLRFLSEEDRPYVLEGLVEAPELAAGELFRQLQPNRSPTLEGLFVARIEFQGAGRTIPDLIDGAQGQIRLQSSGGTIRILNTDSPLVGIGAIAGGLFGTLGGDAAAVSQIAGRLSNMPYTELSLDAERDQAMNLIVRNFRVLSPEVHLQGAGRINYRENLPLLRQPMDLRLRLAAQGPLERLLGAARVLAEEEDELGYRPMRREFSVTGTPVVPDPSVLYRLMIETLMRFVAPSSAPPERRGSNDNDNDNAVGDEERPADRQLIPGIPIPDVFDGFLRGFGI